MDERRGSDAWEKRTELAQEVKAMIDTIPYIFGAADVILVATTERQRSVECGSTAHRTLPSSSQMTPMAKCRFKLLALVELQWEFRT